jgi:3-oxoadipate enol-lactonase
MASGHVEYDGGRLWHQEAGEGPALLLLHAGGADSRMWDGHLERFAQAYRTVRIDLPGAGASPSPDKPYVPNDLLGRLLDVLGIDRAALVGVSAGGGLAIDFAIGLPQRTWALVVVASGPRGIDDIPPDPRMQAFSQAIAAGDRDRAAELFLQAWAPLRTSPELDGRIRRMVHESIGMLEVRPKGLIQLPAWSAARRLGEIGVPTLALWGDRDLPEVGLVGERLVAGVPGARRTRSPARCSPSSTRPRLLSSGGDAGVPGRADPVPPPHPLVELCETDSQQAVAQTCGPGGGAQLGGGVCRLDLPRGTRGRRIAAQRRVCVTTPMGVETVMALTSRAVEDSRSGRLDSLGAGRSLGGRAWGGV